ncbi:MAG: AgmX/PglI C-terminal domain-containing protein [Polyangiales bacterium]
MQNPNALPAQEPEAEAEQMVAGAEAADEPLEGLSPEARRQAWNDIRSAIEEARRSRIPSALPMAETPPAAEPDYGTLEASYIRDAMDEMIPLLAECYELALEEEPELQGRLVLNYTIGGEPEVGGVVEEVAINEESDLRHPILDECVRETIYTAELPAPEEGGQVQVTYPVNFAPDEPEDADDEAGVSQGLR